MQKHVLFYSEQEAAFFSIIFFLSILLCLVISATRWLSTSGKKKFNLHCSLNFRQSFLGGNSSLAHSCDRHFLLKFDASFFETTSSIAAITANWLFLVGRVEV